MPESIAEAYAGYCAAVGLTGAPPVQVEECRRAFVAGSYFLLTALAGYVAADTTSVDEGERYLEALKAEAETFARRLTNDPPAADPADLGQMQYTTPDPDRIQGLLQAIGHRIREGLPPGYGFNLLIFNFGPGGSLFYLSNADREDMLTAMREFIQRQTQ